MAIKPPAIGRVEMSLLGGVFALATIVAGTVQVTLPSNTEVAQVGAQAGLPTLAPETLNQIDRLVRPSDVAHLESVFEDLGFDLARVRAGAPVPRLYVTALPGEMADLASTDRRKTVFISTVLPLVLMANREIENTRHRLLALAAEQAQGHALSEAAEQWVAEVYRRYGVAPEDGLEALLSRVDAIPPSLALAQSIEESGWGTSRFAQEGNALFGQRTWAQQSHGIVPDQRNAEESHKVRSFMNLMGSVRSYLHNLNTHAAYQGLRDSRAAARSQQRPVDGPSLAAGLESYSERGTDYVDQIRGLIRTNKLTELDSATLSTGRASLVSQLEQ